MAARRWAWGCDAASDAQREKKLARPPITATSAWLVRCSCNKILRARSASGTMLENSLQRCHRSLLYRFCGEGAPHFLCQGEKRPLARRTIIVWSDFRSPRSSQRSAPMNLQPISPEITAQLQAHIRSIPDFPQPGILFRDITPLLGDAATLRLTIDLLAAPFRAAQIDYIVGIESRGFLFGMPLAYQLGVGFVPVRKMGKLPHRTLQTEYTLEYGTN